MLRLLSRFSILCALVLSLSFLKVQAADTITVVPATTTPTVIVSPAPAAKETVATPQGWYNCFYVEPGWYRPASTSSSMIWVPKHKVCQYSSAPGAGTFEGVAWIEGYYQCTTYEATKGECTTWSWVPARWVKTLEVY